MWPIGKVFSILNWWIGSIIRAASLRSAGHAGALHSIRPAFRLSTVGSVRSHARRSHHVDHASRKAEQEEHDEPEGRCRQQAVETPADHRSDDNAGDQLRRKPETARHRRGSGSSVSASSSGLVSLDFAAVTKFGQPLIQTSEPCGKRSFIGERFVATSIFAMVLAFSYSVESRNAAALMCIAPRE